MQISDVVNDMAIDYLSEMPIYDRVKNDLESIYKYQEAIYVLANDAEHTDTNTLRVGTILAFSIIGKIIQGKDPHDFSPEDWRDIADNVADYGVFMDGQKYTEFVFNLFAAYIVFSVDINKESITEISAAEIKGLSTEIKTLTSRLDNGEINEPDYVDRCLWVSFEAMIKLLAAYKTRALCPEYAGLIQAVADFSVQYGRYKMYERELDLLDGYLEGQKVLDKELEEKYNSYLVILQAESDEFNNLIEHAFSDNFEEMLKNSVSLAQKAGVDKEKILDSAQKIDSFFMD